MNGWHIEHLSVWRVAARHRSRLRVRVPFRALFGARDRFPLIPPQ